MPKALVTTASARAALEPHPAGRTTMPRLRSDGPCFWATRLTRVLSGEDSCDWAAWFRAHYEDGSWRQMPSDLDQVGWQMAHTAAVIAVRARWEAWATLCTPRIELLRPERGIGQPGRPAGPHRPQAGIARHHRREDREGPPPVVQVMLYMYAVLRCIEEHRGVAFRGQVAYPAVVVDIPAEAVDGEFAGRLSLLLRKLRDSQPARRVPGPMECAYCCPIITTADWPERMPEGGLQEGITKDF